MLEELPDLHPFATAASLYTADQDWSEADEDDDGEYKYFVPDVVKVSALLHELEGDKVCARPGSLSLAEWHVAKRQKVTADARRDADKLVDWWRAEKKKRALKDVGKSALALAPDEEDDVVKQRWSSTRRQHACVPLSLSLSAGPELRDELR